MSLPWVSRALYEAAQQQIADLKEANAKLWELVGAKSDLSTSPEPDDVLVPPKSNRKLASQLRAEFFEEATERARQLKVKK
jgi:hypothetical protein